MNLFQRIKENCSAYYDFVVHRVFKIPLTMAVRYDHCRSRHPKVTVVFLHGIASSYAAWREALPELYRDTDLRDVRFVALDLIGFGKSEKPNWFGYDYENYRKVLKRTLKKLKVDTPIILAGHSMGCLISMDYAKNVDPDLAGLVLISPPILRPRDIAKVPDHFYTKAYGELKNHTDNAVISTIAGFIDAVSSFEKRSLNTQAFQETMDKIILNKHNWKTATTLNMDMRVLHGRIDPLVFGANLRDVADKNHDFLLRETFGGHDITGAKRKRTVTMIKHKAMEVLQQIESEEKA